MKQHDPPLNNTSLAKMLGVHNGTVSRWLSEKTGPNGAEALGLARLFSIPASVLYGYAETDADRAMRLLVDMPADERAVIVGKLLGWMERFSQSLGSSLAGQLAAGERALEHPTARLDLPSPPSTPQPASPRARVARARER